MLKKAARYWYFLQVSVHACMFRAARSLLENSKGPNRLSGNTHYNYTHTIERKTSDTRALCEWVFEELRVYTVVSFLIFDFQTLLYLFVCLLDRLFFGYIQWPIQYRDIFAINGVLVMILVYMLLIKWLFSLKTNKTKTIYNLSALILQK